MYSYNPYSYHYSPPHIQYQPSCPNRPYYPTYLPYRTAPKVDPAIFMNSARQTRPLLKNADLLLQKLADSKQLSVDIMTAAQESKHEKVNELVSSTGIGKISEVTYNPNGLIVTFIDEPNNIDCCHLILKIRWANP
jgi:hypothetical protein